MIQFFPISNYFKMDNFLYKPVRSLLRKIYKDYARDYCYYNRIPLSEFPYKMSINAKLMYIYKDVLTMLKTIEWLEYTYMEDCFESYCAWCYELRSDCPAHDNEHEECDLRMYYLSEPGIAEQEKTLIELKPGLPTIIVDTIMQYLG